MDTKLITIEQFTSAVNSYFEQEIATKATGFKKFAAYFTMANFQPKIAAIASMFAEDNLINIDSIYNSAKSAFAQSGKFSVYGVIFDDSDIEKLYNIILGGINGA